MLRSGLRLMDKSHICFILYPAFVVVLNISGLIIAQVIGEVDGYLCGNRMFLHPPILYPQLVQIICPVLLVSIGKFVSMEGKLTDISTAELLDKFGAGNHKPGSGSASALQGMISAKMLCTVIDLTCEAKRRQTYSAYIPELSRIKKEIDSRIYNQLVTLFEEDSKQFDHVIHFREERDKEKDSQKKESCPY